MEVSAPTVAEHMQDGPSGQHKHIHKKCRVASNDGITQLDTILDQLCTIQPATLEKTAIHRNMNYWVFHQVIKAGPACLRKPGRHDNDNRHGYGGRSQHT